MNQTSYDLFTTAVTFGEAFHGTTRKVSFNLNGGTVQLTYVHKQGVVLPFATITASGLYDIPFPYADVIMTPTGGAEGSLK